MADSAVQILFRLQDEISAGLKAIEDEARRTGKALEDIEGADLGDVESEVEDLKDELEELQEETEEAARDFNALRNAGLAIGAIGAAIAAPFLLAANAAAEFSVQIGEIGTLVPDAVASNEELRRSVIDLSTEFGQDRAAVAAAYYNAVSTGARAGAEATNLLAVASELAIGGVTDINTATRTLTSILNAYGLEARDAQAVSDSLFTTVKDGATTIDELARSLFNVGPTAAAIGVDFREVNAAIATLTLSGTPTSVAATQIRSALAAIARETPEVVEALGEFDTLGEAIEKVGLDGTFNLIAEAANNDIGALTKMLGSIEAVNAVINSTGPNLDTFREKIESQESAFGAASAAADEVRDTFGFQLQQAITAVSNAFVSLGETLLPALTPIVRVIANVAEGFTNFVNDNQAVVGAVTAVVTVLASVVAGLAVLIATFGATAAGIQFATKTLQTFNLQAVVSLSAIRNLATQTTFLGGAIRFALGPIGLLITAFSVMSVAAAATRGEISTLAGEIRTTLAVAETLQGAALARGFIEAQEEVQALTAEIARIEGAFDQTEGTFGRFVAEATDWVPGVGGAITDVEGTLEELREKLEEVTAARDLLGERFSTEDIATALANDVRGFERLKRSVEDSENELSQLQARRQTFARDAQLERQGEPITRLGRQYEQIIEKEGVINENEQAYLDLLDAQIIALQDRNAFLESPIAAAQVIVDEREEQARLAAEKKRLEEEKDARVAASKLREQNIRAEGQLAEAVRQDQLADTLAGIAAEEAALTRQFQRQGGNAAAYFAERERLARDAAAAEVAAETAAIEQIKREREAALATAAEEGFAPDSAEVTLIETQFSTRLQQLQNTVNGINRDLEETIRELGAEAAQAGIEGVAAAVAQVGADLQQALDRLKADLDAGLITQTEFGIQVKAENDRANASYRELLDTLRDLAAFDPSNPEILAQIEAVEAAIMRTTTAVDAFAGRLRTIAENEVADFFEEVLTDVNNVGEAFDNLIRGIGAAVRRLIAERLANKLVDSLFGGTDGEGGLFSFLNFGKKAKDGGLVAATGGLVAATGGLIDAPKPTFRRAKGGGILKLARGGPGPVKGPGTGTSDEVGPLWLSSGEYVMRAAAVRKYGTDMMEAINRGKAPKIDVGRFSVTKPRKHRFASGGQVGPPSAAEVGQAAATAGGTTLNVSEGALNMTMRDFLEREFGRILATR